MQLVIDINVVEADNRYMAGCQIAGMKIKSALYSSAGGAVEGLFHELYSQTNPFFLNLAIQGQNLDELLFPPAQATSQAQQPGATVTG